MKLFEAQLTPGLIRDIVNEQSDWFEKALLKVLFYDREFLGRMLPLICVHPDKGNFMDDFTGSLNNSFYRTFHKYIQNMGLSAPSPTRMLITMLSQSMANAGDFVVDGEPELIGNLYDELEVIPVEHVKPVVYAGVLFWMQQRRMRRVLDMRNAGTSPDEMRELLGRFTKPIREHAEEDYGFAFGHGIRSELLDVVRIPTGLHKFDKCIGGGLGYTEFALGVACMGGGKTVAATQMASSMALAGYKGILITTEQPHEQLEPRIVSCHTRIPFDLIKDKVSKESLSQEQWSRYEELERNLAGRFMIVDWNRRHSKTVVTDLENEIKTRKEQMEGLDFLIMDWLGGNLGAQGATPEMKRTLMKDAADCLGQMAQDHNIATVGFAQINMKQGANRKKLSSEHISENKQLGEKAATIFGISSLLTSDDMSEEGSFKKEQFFYVSKARKSVGGLVPVNREFEYQKFSSR